MTADKTQLRYTSMLTLLVICALLLSVRVVYLYMADAQRFPINTVKISATYQHVTRKQIETVLATHLNDSFFTLPAGQLQAKLAAIDWVEKVDIERIWPDTLKITLVEREPVALWNNTLMTIDGHLFNVDKQPSIIGLPILTGPENQQIDVLHLYQKLNKLLLNYGLQARSLQLRENQAWELALANGVQVRLGKQDLEQRLMRFCKAYASLFADKSEQLSSVDLRYGRGMAVQWKQ
ncbi:MAG: cell division protein FtsQ/DivIB [Legionella sp.]